MPSGSDRVSQTDLESGLSPAASERAQPGQVEVSVVICCLNEERTLGVCIQKAQSAFRPAVETGEVVVADNGSTDGSIEIAQEHGARVVRVDAKRYGNTLQGGFEEARGRLIIMADADDSRDFSEVGLTTRGYSKRQNRQGVRDL